MTLSISADARSSNEKLFKGRNAGSRKFCMRFSSVTPSDGDAPGFAAGTTTDAIPFCVAGPTSCLYACEATKTTAKNDILDVAHEGGDVIVSIPPFRTKA